MILEKIHEKFSLRIKSEKGDGISIVIFGTIAMLALVFTSVNILNAKIIEEKYNTLRDSIQGAAAGSVIHLLLNETGSTNTQQNIISPNPTTSKPKYDIYLQLALGYLVNDITGDPLTSINVVSGTVNNFIKLDHKKVIESTLALISSTVLHTNIQDIVGNNRYDIIMFFIEPNYDTSYKQSFSLISYRTTGGDYNSGVLGGTLNNGTVDTIEIPSGGTLTELYNNLQTAIDDEVGATADGRDFRINLGAPESAEDLVRDMQTRPYYLIVVKDFALPTLFVDGTQSEERTFRDAFRDAVTFNDGRIQTPMCALQAGKVERKVSD